MSEDETSPIQDARDAEPPGHTRRALLILLVSVCMIAMCAIVYELAIATISSYLLGNSVYQFSITIGLFMSSMGLGSFLSRFFKRRLVGSFVVIEVAIGLVGGLSATCLFFVYGQADGDLPYVVTMFGLIIFIGTMIGLEIPILTRIVKQYGTLRVTLANVLGFDYVGALVGSIAFPLLLLRTLGLVQTALAVGLLNVLVALAAIAQYWRDLTARRALLAFVLLSAAVLLTGACAGTHIENWLDAQLYEDQVTLTTQSEYQRIVLTRLRDELSSETEEASCLPAHVMAMRRQDDLRLFIDGQIQFSSVDEYRYHEALVHPAMAHARSREAVLILGGGDGLAAREVLKYDDVERVVLVDLDPAITDLCSTHAELVALNKGALSHPKVVIVNDDGYKFVERARERFDVIVIDLPDPNHESLSKLYAVEFYKLIARILSPGGAVVTQSTSPFFARAAFWCIHHSMAAAGLRVAGYHLHVPSLGEWGFNIASDAEVAPAKLKVHVPTEFLTDDFVPAMFRFGKDTAKLPTKLNTLLRPHLLRYYDDEQWRHY